MAVEVYFVVVVGLCSGCCCVFEAAVVWYAGCCDTIQYNIKNEYYYSGINPVEFRGHSKTSHY